MFWRLLLNWLVNHVDFKLYNSVSPIGRRLGGPDILSVTDAYIILEFWVEGVIRFTGYFQTA